MRTEPRANQLHRPAGGEGLHFVIKRGHHGRYRFTMIGDGGRMTGEVKVDVTGGDRDGLRSVALARIADLASELLGIVATSSAERDDDAHATRPAQTLGADLVRAAGGRAPVQGDRHG